MNRIAIFILLSSLATTARDGDEVKRSRILGISHMALFVSNLQKSRWFYEDFLGYAEPYNLKRDDGSVRIAFIKINEDQYIELFTDTPITFRRRSGFEGGTVREMISKTFLWKAETVHLKLASS
jgi:hypothetical protein